MLTSLAEDLVTGLLLGLVRQLYRESCSSLILPKQLAKFSSILEPGMLPAETLQAEDGSWMS